MVMNMKVVQYIRTDKLKSEMCENASRFKVKKDFSIERRAFLL